MAISKTTVAKSLLATTGAATLAGGTGLLLVAIFADKLQHLPRLQHLTGRSVAAVRYSTGGCGVTCMIGTFGCAFGITLIGVARNPSSTSSEESESDDVDAPDSPLPNERLDQEDLFEREAAALDLLKRCLAKRGSEWIANLKRAMKVADPNHRLYANQTPLMAAIDAHSQSSTKTKGNKNLSANICAFLDPRSEYCIRSFAQKDPNEENALHYIAGSSEIQGDMDHPVAKQLVVFLETLLKELKTSLPKLATKKPNQKIQERVQILINALDTLDQKNAGGLTPRKKALMEHYDPAERKLVGALDNGSSWIEDRRPKPKLAAKLVAIAAEFNRLCPVQD